MCFSAIFCAGVNVFVFKHTCTGAHTQRRILLVHRCLPSQFTFPCVPRHNYRTVYLAVYAAIFSSRRLDLVLRPHPSHKRHTETVNPLARILFRNSKCNIENHLRFWLFTVPLPYMPPHKPYRRLKPQRLKSQIPISPTPEPYSNHSSL